MAVKEFVKLIFGAQDDVSPETEEIAQSIEDLERQKREADATLKDTAAQQKLINKYRDLNATLDASEQAFNEAAAKVDKLQAEFKQASKPTDEMASALERAQREAKAADKAFKSNENAIARLSAQVKGTGADIGKLDQAEASLKAESNAAAAASSNLARQIRTASQATNKQTKETKNLKDSYTEITSKITLFGAAIAGAFVGLKSFLSSAGNAEYANKKLADTLERTTGATYDEITALKAQALALQNSTRFTDEEIKAGQTKLAQQKLTATQVQQLTPLLLDMAEAKRESGDADADTIGSAEAIGDAIRNNISALESFGVHITEATEEQFKNATMAERQIMVMDALSSTFGGAAVAAGETWAGAVDKAGNKTQQALESMAGLITENKIIKKLVGDVAQAFSDMAASIASEAPAINAILSMIATQFGWLLDTARLMGNGLQGVWTGLKIGILELESALIGAWASINEALGNDDTAKGARELAEVVDGQLNQAYKDLEKNGQEVVGTFEKMAQRGADLADSLGGVDQKAKQATEGVDKLKTGVDGLATGAETAQKKLKETFAGLGLSYDKLATGMDETTKQTIDNFGQIINEVTKTNTKAEDLNRILGPALQKVLEEIDTPEGFKALQEKISDTAAESEGLAGVILGTLTPAIDKHAEQLQAQGVYVDDANGRYARMAEILGLEMVDGFYKSAEAAAENSTALENAASSAEAAAARSNAAVTQTAEVASAKGAGIAAFFNAASSMVAELGEKATAQFNQAMSIDAPTGVEYFQQKAETAFKSIERSMGNITTNGLQKFLKKTSIAARQVEADFYTQRASVEKLSLAISDTAYPTEGLIKRAESAMNTFDLLDDSTLSGLRSQIESARAALTSLEDSAKQTLESISQQLANAKGEYSIAVKNQYDQQIAELEVKLAEANAWGSNEAVSDLSEALRDLKELQRIEIQNAKEREKAERQSSRREKSEFTIKIGDTSVNGEASEEEIDKLKRFSAAT